MKEFRKSVNIWQNYEQEYNDIFLPHTGPGLFASSCSTWFVGLRLSVVECYEQTVQCNLTPSRLDLRPIVSN